MGIQTRSGEDLKISLFVVPHIFDPFTPQPISAFAEQFHQFSNLDFAEYDNDGDPPSVDMLIGSDVYWDIVTGEVIRSSGGPVAINTKLEWILSGPVDPSGDTAVNVITSHVLKIDSSTEGLKVKLHSFWELESPGINKREDPVQE